MKIATIIALAATCATAISPPASAHGVIEQPNVSLDLARALADHALVCARGRHYQVAITVVDRSGETLVFVHDDAANPHTFENSRRKAYTARTTKISTAKFADAWFAGDHARVPQATLPSMIALAGGLPIEARGDVIGGIGVSGSPGGDNDELCARRALDELSDQLAGAHQ